MQLKKKLALLLTGILMITTLSACSSETESNNTTENPEQTQGEPAETTENLSTPSDSGLTVALSSTPETIDPALNSSVDGGTYLIHMFEGIMRYTWDGEDIEYGQAESHTVSDDGLVWTFTLRDDIKWSDGQPVTAEDFAYSWRRFVDPDTAAPYAYDMGMYFKNGTAITDGELPPEELGVQVIDERTIEITLEELCPYFLEILAFPTLYPVRRDMIEEHGVGWTRNGDTYICNGPFKMESFTLDDRMVSVKNEHYWDKESAVPESITWLFLSDNIARLAALRSGEASYIEGFPQEERNALEEADMYYMSPLLGTYYLSFNHDVEPFNDPLVRKALTLAIDNAFISDVLRQGAVIPAAAFVGDGFHTSGHDVAFREEGPKYIDPYNYEANKEEARQALAEAGYPDGEGFPRIEFLLNEGAGHEMIAEAVQQMWKDVLNVNAELRTAEWSVLLVDRREGSYQVARNGWLGDFNDPFTMLGMFMSSSANNDCFYSNPEFDELIAQSMRQTDPAARSQLLHQAEAIMFGQDWACAPIYYYTNESAVNPNLKDFSVSLLGYSLFHKAYLSE